LPWRLPRPALGADAAEQDQQIAILQSNRSPAEKDAACARLKWIGDARCVPALAPLLTTNQLSHSARYALESMPGPEAEAALLAGAGQNIRLQSDRHHQFAGVRRDAVAVPALGNLLSDPDTNAARAAAMALGRIGGPQALQALQAAWSDSASGAVHEAEIDGLLACANQLLTEGKDSAALKIFQRLYDTGKTDGTRQAAFAA
jgi:HEAT repeat protein